jgi:membrane-associated phospholipid phosphatase
MADAIKDQLKFMFGRTWPETWVENNPSFIRDGVYGFNWFHGGAGYRSFPSGHMAVTCAVVGVIWIWYPRLRPLCAFVALAVAGGLIGADYHFLSDILAGSYVGISTAWMTTALCEQRAPLRLPGPDA